MLERRYRPRSQRAGRRSDPASTACAGIQSGYVSVSVSARRAGAVWNGVVLIGTRRPGALAAALEQALPGRSGPG